MEPATLFPSRNVREDREYRAILPTPAIDGSISRATVKHLENELRPALLQAASLSDAELHELPVAAAPRCPERITVTSTAFRRNPHVIGSPSCGGPDGDLRVSGRRAEFAVRPGLGRDAVPRKSHTSTCRSPRAADDSGGFTPAPCCPNCSPRRPPRAGFGAVDLPAWPTPPPFFGRRHERIDLPPALPAVAVRKSASPRRKPRPFDMPKPNGLGLRLGLPILETCFRAGGTENERTVRLPTADGRLPRRDRTRPRTVVLRLLAGPRRGAPRPGRPRRRSSGRCGRRWPSTSRGCGWKGCRRRRRRRGRRISPPPDRLAVSAGDGETAGHAHRSRLPPAAGEPLGSPARTDHRLRRRGPAARRVPHELPRPAAELQPRGAGVAAARTRRRGRPGHAGGGQLRPPHRRRRAVLRRVPRDRVVRPRAFRREPRSRHVPGVSQTRVDRRQNAAGSGMVPRDGRGGLPRQPQDRRRTAL